MSHTVTHASLIGLACEVRVPGGRQLCRQRGCPRPSNNLSYPPPGAHGHWIGACKHAQGETREPCTVSNSSRPRKRNLRSRSPEASNLSTQRKATFFAEAFVVNRKRREGSHVTRSQTDKRTHTAPHTRTPPPRLGRRETRGWSSPKEGVQTRMGEER